MGINSGRDKAQVACVFHSHKRFRRPEPALFGAVDGLIYHLKSVVLHGFGKELIYLVTAELLFDNAVVQPAYYLVGAFAVFFHKAHKLICLVGAVGIFPQVDNAYPEFQLSVGEAVGAECVAQRFQLSAIYLAVAVENGERVAAGVENASAQNSVYHFLGAQHGFSAVLMAVHCVDALVIFQRNVHYAQGLAVGVIFSHLAVKCVSVEAHGLSVVILPLVLKGEIYAQHHQHAAQSRKQRRREYSLHYQAAQPYEHTYLNGYFLI